MAPYTPKQGPYIHKERLPDLEGYATLFNNAVVVDGKFLTFSRGTFELELARRTDVVMCLSHDRGRAFAYTRNATLRLWEDGVGLAFSASIPREQKFVFLPEIVAEGRTGVSIKFRIVLENEDQESRVIKSVDLVHLGLTTSPAFPTACWLSNFSLMRYVPPHMKALRERWLDGQKPPPTDLPHDYRYPPGSLKYLSSHLYRNWQS